jgi:quercetin dioxygenase-like cupin family protein
MPHLTDRTDDLDDQQFVLTELVDYQTNSVVSREIISKQTGTVTLFAFDQDEGLSEHTAPFDALAYIIEGEAAISISKEEHILIAGKMIIMPANKPHALKARTRFKMLLVMIK